MYYGTFQFKHTYFSKKGWLDFTGKLEYSIQKWKMSQKISQILFSAWAGGVFGFTLGLSVLSITEHFLLIGKFFWDVISAMKKNWDLEVYRNSSRFLPSA